MQALGEERGRTRNDSNRIPWLNSMAILEKLPVALVFGAVLGLNSPGFDVWWLGWVGLAPLFILIFGCNSVLDAELVGLSFGFSYHLVCHRWILDLYPLTVFQIHDVFAVLAVWLVWFVESVHQASLFGFLAFMAFALPLRSGLLPHFKKPFFPFILSIPLVYIFLQWTVAPSEPFLGVPVNQLAYSQTAVLPLMQMCSLGGCQLLEFIMLSVNCALAVLVMELLPQFIKLIPGRVDRLYPKTGAVLDLFVIVAIVLAVFVWGEWRLRKLTEFPPYQVAPDAKIFAPPVPVAVLQGNIPVRPDALEQFSKKERLDKYTELSQNLGVAMFIVPEAVLRLQEPEGKLLFSRLAGVCHFQRKEALVGSFEMLKNSLVDVIRLIDATGTSNSIYVKTRLLPFVESVPFAALTKVVPENLLGLLPSSKNNFFFSPTPFLLKSAWGNVGTSVSFELVYPELIASEVNNGASLLVNVSDLSWFHNNVLSKQLLAAAVSRAVENGRYLVLASNTGISAVVNPLGVVTSNSLMGQSGNLIDRVQFLSNRTHYNRMWWLWRPSYRLWWH